MLEVQEKNKCCGCGVCVNICPKNCIKMMRDDEGFYYPDVEKENCIGCNLCENVCPMINEAKEKTTHICYSAYSKSDDVLFQSSSGGIFTHIAEKILNDEGVVYGAAFNEINNVEHIRVDNIEKLSLLKKSKYVQSNTKDVFKEVRNDLISGKKVLFTGVGCQINALVNYLNILRVDCTNLITIDVICHGVPSEKVWEKHLKEIGIKNKTMIDFRNKDNGWVSYNVKIGNYNQPHYNDAYMKSFLSDCNLRESCYNCKAKGNNRYADITLGDFWGVNNTEVKVKNNNGTSAVIVHTDKGKEIIDSINESVLLEEVKYEDIAKGNPSYYSSSKRNKNRDEFFRNLDKYDLDRLSKKYCEASAYKKIKYKIKKIIKKIINH